MDTRDDEPSRKSDRREWFIALALALALHAVVILVLGLVTLPGQSRSDMPEPVEVVLTDDPRFFTEQPPDRADQEPEDPQLLSNVASRARDLAPGGDATLPQMLGPSDAPTVKLDPSRSQSPSTTPPAPQANQPGMEPAPQPSSGSAVPTPPGAAGNSDMSQPGMDNPDGNAGLTGDISLSTTDWDYSPWLQRFGREVMRRWMAPPAYYLGLLKDGGWAQIEMEITPAGKVLRVDLVGQQGHPSLILAAQSALRSMNPVEPLPKDFPEPTLILRIRMIYPKYEDLRRGRTEPGSRPTRLR